jgi:D-alanyl-D-alanine carboxypeptidase/D-alanyl-D-alanine-endopeptidase (penicillin-binding protein 4)
VDQALAVERETLISDFGIDGSLFSFPTNGSGTPDSQAAPQALVRLLVEMAKSPVAVPYEDCLPVLGVDGSLAPYGTNLPGRGRVYAKPGTSILPDDQGQLQLKALCLAGYIDTLSGRKVAYALMVNDAGPVSDIETDVGAVFSDQAEISSLIYESL